MSIIKNIIPKPHFYPSNRTCESYEGYSFLIYNSYIFRLKDIAVFLLQKVSL